MKISCKCITHCRVHLLQEALYSFLIQDYEGERELIIVNDYPLQELVFDHPRVKIYNLKETFKTIGEKENYAIERCSGELIAVADDDDIELSHHLSNIMKYWKEDTNLLHWNKAAYYNEPNITAITGTGNSGIVYSKKAWEAIGKSPLENAGGDSTLVKRIKALSPDNVMYASPPDNEVSHFYRWATPQSELGLGNYHQSGQGTDTPDRKNIVQRNSEYIESQRRLGKVPIGIIDLIPAWKRDYSQLLKDYINAH